MTESNDDLQPCEVCGVDAEFDQMTRCGDGCWMCQTCASEAEAAFKSCDHHWTATHDEYGEPAQFCEKCSHVVLNDDFQAVVIR